MSVGILVRLTGAIRKVARGKVFGHLSSVELILQGNLDGTSGESSDSENCLLGVDTSNSPKQEGCHFEVEIRGQDHGHDGGSRVDPRLPCCDLANFMVDGAVDILEQHG